MSLGILEAGVRVADWFQSDKPRVSRQQLSLLRENPEGTGSYRLRPDLDVTIQIESTSVHIKTNSFGMNWRETPLKADTGKKRVAFLGDSFTFGSWATDSNHAFVGVFENHVPKDKYEALNFGVGGYGPVDEELILRELALKFEPAYVIAVLYVGNDFRDNWLGLNRERIENGTAVLNQDVLHARVPAENLIQDDTLSQPCAPSPKRRIAELSAAFRRLEPLLSLENLCVNFRPNKTFLMPAFWSATPPFEVATQAVESVRQTLSRMEELARNHGARFAVVALPTADQVYARLPARRGFDTSQPQSAVGDFCRDRRIPYLDLLPPLRAQTEESNRRLYWKQDIHLNEFGHQRVGELIAEWFQSRVSKEAPTPP